MDSSTELTAREETKSPNSKNKSSRKFLSPVFQTALNSKPLIYKPKEERRSNNNHHERLRKTQNAYQFVLLLSKCTCDDFRSSAKSLKGVLQEDVFDYPARQVCQISINHFEVHQRTLGYGYEPTELGETVSEAN